MFVGDWPHVKTPCSEEGSSSEMLIEVQLAEEGSQPGPRGPSLPCYGDWSLSRGEKSGRPCVRGQQDRGEPCDLREEGMWRWALCCKNVLEDKEESSDCILWAQ